jgi:PHP family Zn ribbon phosphoesterase
MIGKIQLYATNCIHYLRRIDEPAPSGKPYRWKCEKCGKKLKIASGVIRKEDR